LAEQVASHKQLDGVLFVIADRHPFKNNSLSASYADRLAMLRLALEGMPGGVVSEIEREQELTGVSLETVRAIKMRYPETDFRFIIGEDNLADLPRWYRPEELLKEIKMLVGFRPPHGRHDEGAFPQGSFEMVPTELVDVSSTTIRSACRSGGLTEELKELLPPGVGHYIAENRLYV
jgi:nicotinate-nucleotide adenylyltransferase